MGMPKMRGYPYNCDSSTSETRRELEPTLNCFWDSYWGCNDQLLATFFPVPEIFAKVYSSQLLSFFLQSHEIYRAVFHYCAFYKIITVAGCLWMKSLHGTIH